MTYILGADCSDGVVLVGDTKITVRTGSECSYSKKFDMPLNTVKIHKPLNTVVMGSTGIAGLYNEFKDKILFKVFEKETGQKNISNPIYETEEGCRNLISEVIKKMAIDYGRSCELRMCDFSIICASRINGLEASLTLFSPYGYSDQIRAKYMQIGSGALYGEMFLRSLWNPLWTMEHTAKLGIFIIMLIMYLKLDLRVGFSDELLPQVFYIPHIFIPDGFDRDSITKEATVELQKKFPVRELSQNKVRTFINKATSKIDDFLAFLEGNLGRGNE
jgi:20S proteasome alpha/beta subunit